MQRELHIYAMINNYWNANDILLLVENIKEFDNLILEKLWEFIPV